MEDEKRKLATLLAEVTSTHALWALQRGGYAEDPVNFIPGKLNVGCLALHATTFIGMNKAPSPMLYPDFTILGPWSKHNSSWLCHVLAARDSLYPSLDALLP